jgi:hypothetical protein
MSTHTPGPSTFSNRLEISGGRIIPDVTPTHPVGPTPVGPPESAHSTLTGKARLGPGPPFYLAIRNKNCYCQAKQLFDMREESVKTKQQKVCSGCEERVELLREVLHRGAAEMALTTRYETDCGLRWDADREVWVATDDFAYAMSPPGHRYEERGGLGR